MSDAGPPPPGELVDLGGRRIHLNCSGTGAPTVMLENGGGGFSVEWNLVQKEIAKLTRVCSYDRAGYAWSDRGPVDDGIEQVTGDLNLLVRKARLAPYFVFVCHSLGCLYARAYQRRFSEQVLGMVFLDGTPDGDVRMVVNGKREPLSELSREQLPAAHDAYLKSVPILRPGNVGAPPFDRLSPALQQMRQWAFEKVVRELGWLPNTLAAAESWREEFSALRKQRLSSKNPLGDIPLHVVERGKDLNEVWHTQQAQMAALSSGGQLIRAEGSGHMIHLERPDLVAERVREVLHQVRRRRK